MGAQCTTGDPESLVVLTFMAARIQRQPTPVVLSTDSLFTREVVTTRGGNVVAYDLHPDGDRLVVAQNVTRATASEDDDVQPERLILVQNFFEELRQGGAGPVNWEAIGAIGEILGAIAVVGSLVYVASQIKHNTAVSRSEALKEFRIEAARWQMKIAEDERLPPILNRLYHEGARRADLPIEDTLKAATAFLSMLNLLRGELPQRERGDHYGLRSRVIVLLIAVVAPTVRSGFVAYLAKRAWR